MHKFLRSCLLIIVFGLIISCTATKTNDWKRYQKAKDEVVFLQINQDNSTYIAHWIISGSENGVNLFGLITFSGKYTTRDNETIFLLHPNVENNEIKISDGRNVKVPVDSDPELMFNTTNNSLSIFGDTLSTDQNDSKAELDELLIKLESWEGDYIPLGDK